MTPLCRWKDKHIFSWMLNAEAGSYFWWMSFYYESELLSLTEFSSQSLWRNSSLLQKGSFHSIITSFSRYKIILGVLSNQNDKWHLNVHGKSKHSNYLSESNHFWAYWFPDLTAHNILTVLWTYLLCVCCELVPNKVIHIHITALEILYPTLFCYSCITMINFFQLQPCL